jgi:hypothetical protein
VPPLGGGRQFEGSVPRSRDRRVVGPGVGARQRDNFAARYQTARFLQVEAWSDLIIEIGNREDLDAQEKRVRIDTLKWLMSRIVPKKWGDRLLVAGDADSPIQHLHRQVKLTDLSDAQIDALDGFTKSLLAESDAGLKAHAV